MPCLSMVESPRYEPEVFEDLRVRPRVCISAVGESSLGMRSAGRKRKSALPIGASITFVVIRNGVSIRVHLSCDASSSPRELALGTLPGTSPGSVLAEQIRNTLKARPLGKTVIESIPPSSYGEIQRGVSVSVCLRLTQETGAQRQCEAPLFPPSHVCGCPRGRESLK